ncbi:MAG TPA: hypothetical protein VKA32_05690, partial [Gammaproteobacteria bacterium]|nr:hypothetical protein [Gammaproteobacteria bacterium]
TLVLASGVSPRWLRAGVPVRFGPAPTRFGDVSVTVTPGDEDDMRVEWQCDWRQRPAWVEVGTAGGERVTVSPDAYRISLRQRVAT